MFQKARIKLTAWYLLIIMLISVSFSIVIYKFLINEFEKFAAMQRTRIERRFLDDNRLPPGFKFQAPIIYENDLVEEARKRILFYLIGVNGVILILSGGLGYFLSGRTLDPIRKMVDDQNQFIADASHELRTPLTALKLATEVGLRDKKITLTQSLDLLKENLKEINDLHKLSDNLLKLSSFDESNGYHIFSPVDLSEIFYEVDKKIKPLAEDKKIKINILKTNLTIRADKESLVELILILIDNAIKYSPTSSEINISAKRIDGKVLIKVEDHGMGIDQESLAHIFDRFYRAEKSRTKSKSTGYGLGLPIAKKIVQLHHGEIKVESKIEEGTIVKVWLPA